MEHSFPIFSEFSPHSLEPFGKKQLTLSQISENGLTREELRILLLMYQTSNDNGKIKTTYSFQGIRRACNIHQARLTKALNRLIMKGAIIKTNYGYELTEHGQALASRIKQSLPTFIENKNESQKYIAILNGNIMSENINSDTFSKIQDKLIGKWFSNLRFYSVTHGENLLQFHWVGESPPTLTATLSISPPKTINGYIIAKNEETLYSSINAFIQRITQEFESLGIKIEFNKIIYLNDSKTDVIAS